MTRKRNDPNKREVQKMIEDLGGGERSTVASWRDYISLRLRADDKHHLDLLSSGDHSREEVREWLRDPETQKYYAEKREELGFDHGNLPAPEDFEDEQEDGDK